jgi:hypothetical protein
MIEELQRRNFAATTIRTYVFRIGPLSQLTVTYGTVCLFAHLSHASGPSLLMWP